MHMKIFVCKQVKIKYYNKYTIIIINLNHLCNFALQWMPSKQKIESNWKEEIIYI